jgi:hypothetical protein
VSALASLRRHAAGLVAAFAASLAVAGCGPDFDHAEIDNAKPSLPGGRIGYSRVEVPVGSLVTAHIVSYDDDHKPMAMRLFTKDATVIDVHNVVSEHDYAFFGLRPGVTEVEMTAGGKVVLILTAVVTEQTPP